MKDYVDMQRITLS